MKILHISTRLIIGGSQENTVLSCEGQAVRGHEVHLAYGPIDGPEGSMLPRARDFRTPDGQALTLHEVPDLIREIDRTRDRRCLHQLRELVRELKPDIVHTHSSKAGILGRIAAWKEGGRKGHPGVIHTVHGPPFHRYEAMQRNALYIMAEKYAAARCHRIITVCDMMRTQFLANRIGRPEQYETVYSGMDLAPYAEPITPEMRVEARRRLKLRPDAVVIGTVSRLADLKGHDDIIDAIQDEMREFPEWTLLWVGDGWKREQLEGRLRNMVLRERVRITGMIPPEEVPAAISAMDLLVHPSYREGLPRVVVQALLSGVPVVATHVDGTSEAVLDPVSGRLVTPGDLVGLQRAIVETVARIDRARTGALKGREFCLGRFGAERMVDELERIYSETIEGRPSSATRFMQTGRI
ncbi:MAG: glycosyltransferase family 4 protein [Phycisphaerales bacterium]|nr:glycosyltransferase family 4 protein [Phycisphaerales bacterium]